MNQSKASYQLPKLCCRCGEKQGVAFRTIYSSRVSGVGFYVVATSVKTSNFTFSVPVCDECSKKLVGLDKKQKFFRIVFFLLIALWSFYYSSSLNLNILFGLALSIAIFIFGYSNIGKLPTTGHGMGGYTGTYFWFLNKNFFKQFAELNPQLVSPIDHHRLTAPPTTSTDPGFVWTRSNKILISVILLFVLSTLGLCIINILIN